MEDTKAIVISQKRRPMIAMTALLNGQDITMPDGGTLHLFKPGEEIRWTKEEYGESDKYFLAYKLDCQSGDYEYNIYAGADLTLSGFFDLCNQFKEEDLVVMAANNALCEINVKKQFGGSHV